MIDPARLAVAAHQMRCEATFRIVKGIFSGLGIDLIVLKGPHLGNTIYENPSHRFYGDLDLLVKPADFKAAAAALEKSNFYPLAFSSFSKQVQDDFKHWEYQSPQGIVVELHRWLSGHDRHPIDVEGLFARSESFSFGETTAKGLGTVDLLLHLCLHMGTSYFKAIERKHILDIALLVAGKPIDWSLFIDRVNRGGAGAISYYALLAARRQDAAAVPDEVLSRLRPGFLRRKWIQRLIDPGVFPIYRFPEHSMKRVKMNLLLPLMDKPVQWMRFARKMSKNL